MTNTIYNIFAGDTTIARGGKVWPFDADESEGESVRT